MENKILVPIDYSDVSKKVLKFADEWAKNAGAELYVLAVTQLPIHYTSYSIDNTYEEYLNDFVKSLELSSKVNTVHRLGIPYLEIIKLEKELNSNLVIMAAHSHTILGRIFMGSNTDYVVHHSTCPIYIYKESEKKFSNVIIVPVDFSEINKPIISMADEWAQRIKAKIIFIHVLNLPEPIFPEMEKFWDINIGDEQFFNNKKKELIDFIKSFKVKEPYECIIKFGKPYLEIMELQQQTNAGLIMTSSHSHNLFERIFLGSNTDYLLHHIHCPMYVYKAHN